jgi:PAS domain S-box-containing protein
MFQTFIDTAIVPIFAIDLQGRVNEWNRKTAEISGLSSDEVLGTLLVDVPGFTSIHSILDQALMGVETENYEYTLHTRSSKRELLLNATTWRDVDGITIIGVIIVAQDITERKKIEYEKARVALELQSFIDTANAPIFGIDANGLVNEWNNKSAAITGFSREEVLGKNLVKVW